MFDLVLVLLNKHYISKIGVNRNYLARVIDRIVMELSSQDMLICCRAIAFHRKFARLVGLKVYNENVNEGECKGVKMESRDKLGNDRM